MPGIDTVPTLDNVSVMELDAVPEHLVIVGGSYIGLEFAQVMRRLAAVPALSAAHPDEFEDYRAIYAMLARQHADAIVTVKFVMSVTNSGNEQRVEDRTLMLKPGATYLLQVGPRRYARVTL